MNNTDALAQKIDEMIPKDWDEIVTKNKHLLDVSRADDADIAELNAYVESGQVKDTIDNYTVVKFSSKNGPSRIFLVGDRLSSGYAIYTSYIEAIDVKAGLVRTMNSLYALGEPSTGAPKFEHLVAVCALINRYGYCDVLGVTPFFY